MITLGFVALILLLIAIGAIYQYVGTKIDEKKYPPLGKLVDVGGYRLHIHCMGDTGPTVVLESGFGVDSLGWSLVQPEIAKFARVCSYDRAGYGWSEESLYPRTGKQIVEELHTLLKNAKISPPYILVGHSFGGGIVQHYTQQYPDEVIGLVLVDSCHEKQDEMLPPDQEKTWREKLFSSPKFRLFISQIGIRRLKMHSSKYKKSFEKAFRMFPAVTKEMILANQRSLKNGQAMIKESIHFDLSQYKNVSFSFDSLPLIVIASAKLIDAKGISVTNSQYFEKLNKAFRLLQDDLATRSSKGKLMIAEKSDHMIPFNQPEIIVEAVKQIIGK